MSGNKGWIACVLLLLACAGAEAQMTNAEAEQRVLGEALSPVLAALESHGAAPVIEVEILEMTTGVQAFGKGVVEFLEARGHAARLLRPRAEPGEGLALSLEVLDAGFQQDEKRRNFLGFEPEKTLRRMDLVMVAMLIDVGADEILFDGIVEAHSADWLDSDEAEEREQNALLPLRRSSSQGNQQPSARSWTERGLAVGLLSGVIILYFSGIS